MSDIEIELCRLAFIERHPDATERASRLLARSQERLATFAKMRRLGALGDGKPAMARVNTVAQRIVDITVMIQEYTNRSIPIEAGPTAELLMQIRKGRKGDPLIRLAAQEKITFEQLGYAREIGGIVYATTRNLNAKTMNLPVKCEADDAGGHYRDVAEAVEWMAMLRNFVYLPWADRVRQDIGMIHGLIVDGDSLNTLARKYQMRKEKVLNRFRAAVEEYGEIRRGYLRHETAIERQPRVDATPPWAVLRWARPGP